ncbi:hypothetical protein K438DRAFT_1974470 [Mycena galopus ATCC 62051]|nr:hypothetical protein K438DRAFT_1974470 [Mycena galopus ATCC 62051]
MSQVGGPADLQRGDLQRGERLADTGFIFLQPLWIPLHYESTSCPPRTDSGGEWLSSMREAQAPELQEFSAPRLTLTLSSNPQPFQSIICFYLNPRHSSLLMPAQTQNSLSHSFPCLPPVLPVYPSISSFTILEFNMPCIPPYYPCPGHESLDCHDRNAQWIARAQTEGYTDSMQKGFRTWNEAEDWWRARCTEKHGGICPEFEPHPAGAPVGSARAAAAPAPGSLNPPPPILPTAAPSPFCSPSSTSSSITASMSPYARIPTRVTPFTRVHLTASGRVHPTQAGARAGDLTSNATLAHGLNAVPTAAAHAAAPDPAAPAAAADPATPRTRGYAANPGPGPSVLVTPSAGAQNRTVPAPAPAPVPALEVPMYGIRGVAVFYNSHAEASAAAASLGLTNPRIMVSNNTLKLEAWMLGKPFVREDN